eukprot:CAMPEP_0201483724 /NCGR_PEP_ID=MMETSP0151_2-20130828/7923_1 /ASSEMBLY_ACC=CAM_ASM_000257 /TAXON_ID=200890 /ORGANISM="Paramoeba atlantica, Strain 621/1 / CCAP 1560/9" /LENGTH=61 /DNA_ID=CAMNT_0047867011 /DNA_START=86 /DNA_END=271 /DNA_ORIENTATION=-
MRRVEPVNVKPARSDEEEKKEVAPSSPKSSPVPFQRSASLEFEPVVVKPVSKGEDDEDLNE